MEVVIEMLADSMSQRGAAQQDRVLSSSDRSIPSAKDYGDPYSPKDALNSCSSALMSLNGRCARLHPLSVCFLPRLARVHPCSRAFLS